jgi:hypothetical protein
MKILYLLGAGASAQALPLIKRGKDGPRGLPDALIEFIEVNTSEILQVNDWDQNRINALKAIATQCRSFGTPDLYAKFLVETGDDEKYNLLNRLLSNYFTCMQNVHNAGAANVAPSFDIRTLSFLTAISQDMKIPRDISILSWNYDSQIEMAAEKLRPVNGRDFKTIQGFNCWPNIADGENISDGTEPFLFHLNGVAGYMYSPRVLAERRSECFNFIDIDQPSLLSFAWEEERNHGKRTFLEKRIGMAQRICHGVQILVVIGYSFPFFNRKIDSELFGAMLPYLRKIYFQDPVLNGKQLAEQFDLSANVRENIIHIEQVDNYHIPYEF